MSANPTPATRQTTATAPASDTPVDAQVESGVLTPHVALKRVVMLVNPLSGSVGPKAAGEAQAILERYACETLVVTLEPGQFDDQVQAAFDSKPDVLFVLAGDGTAGTIASRAGPDGPLVAPLPGGTMNMLPRALYGTADWKAALKIALEDGAPQIVAGGEITDGRTTQSFYCAAIFGSPALWAPAREAVRHGKFGLAWAYGRRALKRAFSGQMRFSLDGTVPRRAEALVLISPMISRAMDEASGLEAAVMNPSDAGQVFRMAAHAMLDDWRQDPAVSTRATQLIAMRARSRIPAVVDGEPMQLRHEARVRFIRQAFRALAPTPPAAEDSV
ncbi:MAG: diacylglycerol kinase family lipid kinase [Alphaproteobacteria bacterium]|nr:diacylglycerol kinase family lipid kinase [Alphaproteobacteria bacterium]MBU2270566.1 diacylglycerol kinase family lipid kinase [Alphaproteobacteria bacterium]MBU2417137.1 diacylglycerol kinase family lipid kinase [Alphaproteobacteria bacterium]